MTLQDFQQYGFKAETRPQDLIQRKHISATHLISLVSEESSWSRFPCPRGKCICVVQPVKEISSKRCSHWVSPALYLPNVTDMSKVHPAGKNKETEWLAEAVLGDGTAHQKRECVYVEGSGQITPPFPVVFQEGDPFSDITFVRFSALVLGPYPPASWASQTFINKYECWPKGT